MKNKAELLTMSQKEIKRVELLEKLSAKLLTQKEVAVLLNIATRQVRRLQKIYKKEGPAGLISKRRGSSSNNHLPSELKKTAIALIKQHYHDFGPTLAHEKLTEQHQLVISVESLRQLMMKEGLLQGKKKRIATVHQMRTRRACLGELIQIDGSPHAWFEDRGPVCCLLVFVDDATGKIMMLHFEEVESTQGYFDATQKYIMQHGLPLAFYSDRHGIFRVNAKEAQTGTGETQYSRALRELSITLINANSPQAKGRVENKNGTLQDRLVKELRLRNISGIISANDFAPHFMEDYNKRFAKPATNPIDMHRPLTLSSEALRDILSHQELRIITKNLEVHYNNNIYQIQTDKPCYTMRQGKVTVRENTAGVQLIYKGKKLNYKLFEKHNQTTCIASSKELNIHIDEIMTNRKKPAHNHPWRTPGRKTTLPIQRVD